jgi:polyisoprenoid-binding protein YceI
MKKFSFAIAAAAVMLLSAFTTFQSTDWKISEGYSIKFSSDNPSGVFTKMEGDIAFDPAHPEASKFNVSVDVNSINTGNGMKNKHAKSSKWFDADTYPRITFVSDKFTKTGNGYEVTGTMELHGVKKAMTIPFTFSNNTFNGSFKINRTDYNLGATTGMMGKADKELLVELSVPVTKK